MGRTTTIGADAGLGRWRALIRSHGGLMLNESVYRQLGAAVFHYGTRRAHQAVHQRHANWTSMPAGANRDIDKLQAILRQLALLKNHP